LRNEQRPWLAISEPDLYYARNLDVVQFQFALTNHGKTPCAVHAAVYGLAFELDTDTAIARAKASVAPQKSNEGAVIAPGCTAKAVAEFPIAWTEEQLQAMTPGTLCYAVAGRITYGRDESEICETGFLFGGKVSYHELIVLGGAAENYMK
jgi:hypothetical protein